MLIALARSRSVRGASQHPAFMSNVTAQLLLTHVRLISLVDKFVFLFLMQLNKMRTLGESKV